MAISREGFCGATTDQVLVDDYAKEWAVLKKMGGDPFPKLLVQCPGHKAEEIMFVGDCIVDAEFGAIVELNCPTALIKSKN